MGTQALADKIRDLAAQGMSISAIAGRLKYTRQHISALCKRFDIPHVRGERKYEWRKPREPKPTVLATAGLTVPPSKHLRGAVAEILVAADLLARGYLVYRAVCGVRGHDVIATNGSAILTFEVRTARRRMDGKVVYSRTNNCGSSHHAIVLPGEPILYEPPLM
jgi:hypothetical protein